MTADAGVAGFADRGASFVDFLNHRSDEAGEFRNLARQDRLPEINVGKKPIERVLGSQLRVGVAQWLHNTVRTVARSE
jgi:hypothetical protein